jgi:hypothetical protein
VADVLLGQGVATWPETRRWDGIRFRSTIQFVGGQLALAAGVMM